MTADFDTVLVVEQLWTHGPWMFNESIRHWGPMIGVYMKVARCLIEHGVFSIPQKSSMEGRAVGMSTLGPA
jgi:hypothetical protein